VAARNITNVKMAGGADVLPERLDQVSFHDLDVIEVEQNLQIWAADFADDGEGFSGAVQIVVGVVVAIGTQRLDGRECVDHFQNHGDALGRDYIVRALESFDNAGVFAVRASGAGL